LAWKIPDSNHEALQSLDRASVTDGESLGFKAVADNHLHGTITDDELRIPLEEGGKGAGIMPSIASLPAGNT
jgi:hypothetical protein